MWRCPNCGEQIGDEFDLCWNCGTAPDGTRAADFHAEPSDSAVPDHGPEPEKQPESAAGGAAEQSAVDRRRIVELCSAADVVESHGLCDVLQEAGIPARVVGEYLGGAAGSLPLGEPIAPRIWVREADLDRARKIIEQRREQSSEPVPVEQPVGKELPEWETPAEQDEGPLTSDVRYRFLSQGFFIVGLAVVLFGSVRAWQNGITLSKHSATTEGQRVGAGFSGGMAIPLPGGSDQPVGRRFSYRFPTGALYTYVVGHTVYYAGIAHADLAPDRVTIHYNPRVPTEHVVGAVIPPWLMLASVLGISAFLMFVGYQFR